MEQKYCIMGNVSVWTEPLARRPDGAVLKFTPTPKKKQSPSPFIRTQRLARGCLTSQQVRELACLCLRIEEHFDGTPQDIEWSYGLGEFYLHQSRPIKRQ